MAPALHVRPQRTFEIRVDRLDIEPRRIKMPAAPALEQKMLGMVHVVHNLEKPLIAHPPTHIFGWRRPRASNAAGINHREIQRQKFLDFDRVLPIVAKIIAIKQGGLGRKIGKRHAPIIEDALILAVPIQQRLVAIKISPTSNR